MGKSDGHPADEVICKIILMKQDQIFRLHKIADRHTLIDQMRYLKKGAEKQALAQPIPVERKLMLFYFFKPDFMIIIP